MSTTVARKPGVPGIVRLDAAKWAGPLSTYNEDCKRLARLESEARPLREKLAALKLDLRADMAGQRTAVCGKGMVISLDDTKGGAPATIKPAGVANKIPWSDIVSVRTKAQEVFDAEGAELFGGRSNSIKVTVEGKA